MPKAVKSNRAKKGKSPLHLPGGRTARKRTVANAYGNGFDKQTVVQDTITSMRERGQLSEGQFMAATRYREAFDTTSAVGSVLDDSKTGGSGFGPRGKSEHVMMAAETLSRAAKAMGMIDGFVVRAVVGEGHSIREVAAMLYDSPSTREQDEIGKRLRGGLNLLAGMWFGRAGRMKYGTLAATMDPDARPSQVIPGVREIDPKAASGSYGADGVFRVRKPGQQ